MFIVMRVEEYVEGECLLLLPLTTSLSLGRDPRFWAPVAGQVWSGQQHRTSVAVQEGPGLEHS